jgi:hypothetical protein
MSIGVFHINFAQISRHALKVA